ncbi:MAG: hypothetical protein HC808_16770 [Candidatus Competibacteraceae bacterium]|nr:hypothetical protein [Candidatus Competibacteraceae bacterium]
MNRPIYRVGTIDLPGFWCSPTYRAVYTVKFAGAMYVLHYFQKKSTRGIATPKPDLE